MTKRKSPGKKSQANSLDKLLSQARKARDKDIVERGRALKRLGLYEPKQLTQKTLTRSQRKTIEAKFKELQQQTIYTKYIAHHPLQKTDKGTYKLTDYFSFIRTKKRPTMQHSGIKATSKGLIVSHPGNVKARINKKGEIIEVNKARGTIKRNRPYRNGDLYKILHDAADRGKLPKGWNKKSILVIHPFGTRNESLTRGIDLTDEREVREYLYGYIESRSSKSVEAFYSMSWAEIIEPLDD